MWAFNVTMETGVPPTAEIASIPAYVPGSVQLALRDAGVIPDWNYGLRSRECEWVENRHWILETILPGSWCHGNAWLRCLGLDGSGWIYVNGAKVAEFENAFVPQAFNVTPWLQEGDNRLQIVFDLSPRWLGQLGYTSAIRALKPRYNYTWDWTPRLVQIGIWDQIVLESGEGARLGELRCRTWLDEAGEGSMFVQGGTNEAADCTVRLRLTDANDRQIREQQVSTAALADGMVIRALPVEAWWPNGCGDQTLYSVTVELIDRDHVIHDLWSRRVGFKSIRWEACAGATAGADPWLCVINGQRLFLQGVNWVPVRPNFADVTPVERRARLECYRDIGCNVIRVWGGAFLPPESFFDDCDELGLLVWQDFPLSSSGLGNEPPRDEEMVEAFGAIADSYIRRRQHHASLLLWCGGNELMHDNQSAEGGIPLDVSHPMLHRMAQAVADLDPDRRFVPTSSSGPRFMALASDFGKGLHWDVHGPWKADGDLAETWDSYWEQDDALFRSETGAPGASPLDIIQEYADGLNPVPGTKDNPLWQRSLWWIEWPVFVAETGREPESLGEYVTWSQRRQALALAQAVTMCKRRFPAIGGIILWCGHDAFPCMANTSILDFYGRLKPAAEAVRDVFLAPMPQAEPVVAFAAAVGTAQEAYPTN